MQSTFKHIVLALVVAAITIPAALIHGRLTHRWTDDSTLLRHAAQIGLIPDRMHEWRKVHDVEDLSSSVQQELGIQAHINRVYENDTGKRVTVLVMIGESGPLVRHPVEICYGNRAKRLVSSNSLTFEHESRTQNFQVRRYEPKSSMEDEFYVAYAFGSRGQWDVPASPRLAYGGEPVLYKMQILTNAESIPPEQVPEHLTEFVQQFSQIVLAAEEAK